MNVQPYVFFHGRCEEALEFYKRALGAEITMLMRHEESPEAPREGTPLSAEMAKKVLHAELRIGETVILASDGHTLGKAAFAGFSLAISAQDDAAVSRLCSNLGEGGTVVQSPTRTFFASSFCVVTDRFGLEWMVLAPPAEEG